MPAPQTVWLLLLAAGLLLPAAGAPAQETPAAQLFPQAMVVEHQLIERAADATVFHHEPVRDTYGGSWIVSERSDGSRLVIDLARREMTEIRPADGVYWTLGFARFGELRARAARLGGGPLPLAAAKSVGGSAEDGEADGEASGDGREAPAELELIELSGVAVKQADAEAGREGWPAGLAAPEIRRFEVRRKGSPLPGAEVWVDPRLRLGAAAGAAIEAFEEDALGSRGAGEGRILDPAQVMAAVRRASAGALPVLTVLPVTRRSGEVVGESEDRALSTRLIDAFPSDLARVPEGLKRTSHPLESIVLALEEQERIDAALAGRELP